MQSEREREEQWIGYAWPSETFTSGISITFMRGNSVVEWRSHKPHVGSSTLPPATNFLCVAEVGLARRLGRWDGGSNPSVETKFMVFVVQRLEY